MLAVVFALIATALPAAAATRTISGTVSLPSGFSSAAFAAVTAVASDGERDVKAKVSSTGRYSIDGLAPGSYDVKFEIGSYKNSSGTTIEPNLVPEWHDNVRVKGEATPVNVTNSSRRLIDAALEVGATISGTVTVPSGTASTWKKYVSVRASRPDGTGKSEATLDANGRYTLKRLWDGDYIVVFTVDTGLGNKINLVQEYYSDATTPDDATPVTVPSTGATVTGIDTQMNAGSTLAVNVAGLTDDTAYLGLRDADGTVVSWGKVDAATKTLTLIGIPAGTFFLGLTTYPSGGGLTFQHLRDEQGQAAWSFEEPRSQTISVTANVARSRITGTVTAYGFSGYERSGDQLGGIYVYQDLDGTWVLMPELTYNSFSISANGTVPYSFGNVDAGTYAVRFGPTRDGVNTAARQWTGNGPIREQWFRNGYSTESAQLFTVSRFGTARDINGTIRPQNWTRFATGFTDVTDDQNDPAYSPFAEAVTWMKDRGISTGWVLADDESEYRPRLQISREAMAAFLYRAAGQPAFDPPAQSPFVDVTPSSPFYREITWLAAQDVSTGWSTPQGQEYRPKAEISREAMAAFLYRGAGPSAFDPPVESPFVDVDLSSPFYAEITWLAAKGISTGWTTASGQEYRPRAKITREAMAAFLYRAAQLAAQG